MSSNTIAKSGRDFGSFHTSNVEELIRLSDEVYQEPSLSVVFNSDAYHIDDIKNSTERIKTDLFNLDEKFLFLNHGAFGLTFKPVLDYIHKWHYYSESQPLRFHDRQVLQLLVDIVRKLAKVLECKPTELVLVENCTFAFNSVVKSLKLNRNEKIFIFSTTYGCYKKILRRLCGDKAAELIEETIDFPILDKTDLNSKTVDRLKLHLEADDKKKLIKYIVVDFIPSNTPFLMPIKDIEQLVHSKRPDIILIVDGAHAMGSINSLNLDDLNVDVLFLNCHKWFCGPKGTALLYKNQKTDFDLKTAVESHGIGSGFHSEFLWSGLKDYCSFLGLYATLDLWHGLGGFHTVIAYCEGLARQAAVMLKTRWNTAYLVDPGLCSTMLCVRLPMRFVKTILGQSDRSKEPQHEFTYDDAELIQNYLYFKQSIEAPIKSVQNSLWIRISCHIYNSLDDYERLADVIDSVNQ
jgi:isopenicillin-N epimerase